ncbi:hypothetical protein [Streptococcus anginosus]|uniref:hypothetical protein n=1 Tax=Streptococcus anginosus TaxID=1328 RepID=UPI0003549D67|nr:hypothetical protein [Streptococcus anginosus]MDB8660706.1 hypothetical protein [Streptococcus anginosus]MDP1383980.1 hypothetical protein [Streptococcus anginosus]BAN61749.1 hypothetical protein ANG_1279 [Streptococcus anginosus subsp. whileyi MAS624]
MSVKVTYNCYINLCEDYMYGKKFLALPEKSRMPLISALMVQNLKRLEMEIKMICG